MVVTKIMKRKKQEKERVKKQKLRDIIQNLKSGIISSKYNVIQEEIRNIVETTTPSKELYD